MAMSTQAFRYAYEPFVFGKNKDSDIKTMYFSAMVVRWKISEKCDKVSIKKFQTGETRRLL